MENLRSTPVFSNATITITAVELVETTRTSLAGCHQLFGKAEPIALVISDQHGTRALDMAGKAMDINLLPAKLWSEHRSPTG